MTNELIAVANGQEMGLVRRSQKGKLSFTYSEKWAASEESYPLSLSMPLGLAEHGHGKIEPFLWGCCRTTRWFSRAGAGSFRFPREAPSD